MTNWPHFVKTNTARLITLIDHILPIKYMNRFDKTLYNLLHFIEHISENISNL